MTILSGTGISSSLSQLTIEVWVCHRSLPDTGYYQRYVTLGGEVAVLRQDRYNGQPKLDFYIKTNGGLHHVQSAVGAMEVGKWYHIAGTWDGTTMKLYLNGKLIGQSTPGGSLDSPDGSIRISHVTETMDGYIDEVRIWNTARTAQEIREGMCRVLGGDETGLVAYWRFDQDEGAKLYDVTGHGHDGTLKNMGDEDWVSCSAFNTWIGCAGTSWSTDANWSGGAAPSSADNVGVVHYTDGNAPTLSGSPTVNSLVIGSGATLTMNSDLTVNGTLATNNELDLNGNTIMLGSNATLVESAGNTVKGTSGKITTTRTFNAGDLSGGGERRRTGREAHHGFGIGGNHHLPRARQANRGQRPDEHTAVL